MYLYNGFYVGCTKTGRLCHLLGKWGSPLCGRDGLNIVKYINKRSVVFPKIRSTKSKRICIKCDTISNIKIFSDNDSETESNSDSDSDSDSDTETDSESESDSDEDNYDDMVTDQKTVVKVVRDTDIQDPSTVYSFLVRLYKIAMSSPVYIEDINYPSLKVLDKSIQLISWIMNLNVIDYDYLPISRTISKLQMLDSNLSMRSRPEIEKKIAEYDKEYDDLSPVGKKIISFLIRCCMWVLRDKNMRNKPLDILFVTEEEIKNIDIPNLSLSGSNSYRKTYMMLIAYKRAYNDEITNSYLEGRIEGFKETLKTIISSCSVKKSVERCFKP